MTLYTNAEYRVSEKAYNAARHICSKINSQTGRKRAFKALICMDTLADYLFAQGLKIDISKNLYKVAQINEEFEFTDIHYNGNFINILPVVNGKYVLIPKIHFTYDIVPDLYVVADYSQTSKKVRFLGCIDQTNLNKARQNDKYFVMELNNLLSPDIIETKLNTVKAVDNEDFVNHELIQSYFIDYIDGVLAENNKQKLISHLIECKNCRNVLVEFYDYESIAEKTKKYPDVFADSTLDIVGAAAVNSEKYKNFEEITLEIDKEPDEYEEDENENEEGKTIKPAIDDPLQVLYGKGKNREIFELLNEKPKKEVKSMLSNVMDDIAKEQSPDTHTIETPSQSKYKGVINPEYYAEDLSEGFEQNEKEQEKTPFENISEEIQPAPEKHTNSEGKPLYLEDITIAENNFTEEEQPINEEKTDEIPAFAAQLNPQPKTEMSATDELILLDDEQEVDLPQFSAELNKENDEKSTEKDETDNLIFTSEEQDEYPELQAPQEEDIPTAMDSLIYIDHNEEQEKTAESETITDDSELLLSTENDDFTLLEDNDEDIIDVSADTISDTVVPTENELQNPQTEKIQDNFLDLSDINIESPDNDSEKSDITDTTTENDEFTLIDDNSTIADIDTDLLNEDEDDLIHINAEDIDLVDENDLEYFSNDENSVIPTTIAEAGVAGSSLLDYEETPPENNFIHNTTVETEDNLLSDEVLGLSTTNEDEQSTDDDLIIIDDDNNEKTPAYEDFTTRITDNTDSVEETISDDDLLIFDNDEEQLPAHEDFTTGITDSTNSVQTSSNDDMVIFDDEDSETPAYEDFTTGITDTSNDLNLDTNDDDMIIIDDDEEDQSNTQEQTPSTNSVSNNSDDDMIIFDDEDEEDNTQKQALDTNSVIGNSDDDMIIFDDEDEEDDAQKQTLDTNSVINNSNDDMIIFDDDEPQKTDTVTPSETTINTDSSDDILTETEDDSNLLDFGNEDDSFFLEEEQGDFSLEEDTKLTDVQSDETDDLLYYDGDAVTAEPKKENKIADNTFLDNDYHPSEKELSSIQNQQQPQATAEEDEDDDLIIFDDNDDPNSFVRPASLQNDFVRPASLREEPIETPTTSEVEPEEDDDLMIIDDLDDIPTDIPSIAEEQKDLPQETETPAEEKAVEDKPKKAPSQLDIIFNSLSEREKENLAKVQNKTEEKTEEIQEEKPPVQPVAEKIEAITANDEEDEEPIEFVDPEQEEETLKEESTIQPKAEAPKTIFREFKDAIAAKEEAKESGKFDNLPESVPVEEPLINSTKSQADEDEEYEYVEEYVDEADEDENSEPAINSSENENENMPDESEAEEEGDDAEYDDEEYEDGEEYEEEDEDSSDKKGLIKKVAIGVAILVVLAAAGFTAKTFLTKNNNVQNEQALEAGADMPTDEEGGLSIPSTEPQGEQLPTGEGEEGGLAIPAAGSNEQIGETMPPEQQAPTPSAPKAGTPNATTEDMNKAVTNAFSETPTAISIHKLSWGVSATLASDTALKQYLQSVGKIIKSDLQKNLATIKGVTPTSAAKVQIKMGENGGLQDVVITKSSGVTEIDDVVLQSVKQSVNSCPLPILAEATLQANEQATNSKTVKMSLTVTF